MPRAQFWTRLSSGISLAFLGIILFALCGCQLLTKQSAELEQAKNPCLVLALPASGPYSPIAAKIKRGAEVARQELARTGTQTRLENINTEAPDWLARLAALPPMCAVVGGPLQEKSYLEARKAGLLQQRAFFAFVPTLSQGDEGRQAWRFFPSPQDQVEALLNFTTDQMNIRSYGAFYPADNYGRRMTEIMESNLRKRQIPLQKASYTPNAPATWKSSAASLVNPRKAEDGKNIIPQTVFEAVFLPDSWKNLDMLTTSFMANGEDRLALLGTTLWEQGLSGKQVPKAERYALAVFPAPWNQSRAPAALRAKNNDFWSALGYDFMNFGTAVALAMRPEAAQITARAQKAAPAIRGLAPINWDNSGVAHQHMYLFQITPGGMAPLDGERFRQARTAISERAALRMQGWSNINPDTGEALPESMAQDEVDDSGVRQTVEPARLQPEPSPPPEPARVEPTSSAPAEPAVIAAPPQVDTPTQPAVRKTNSQHPPESPLAAPAMSPHIGQPDPGPSVMSDTPRSSYKLSLPIKK